ncbi:hypothetical protein PN462_05460 [Spirulina sp. CS-785/01]|uniref:hypothetical protein n=1 Tax=Spirulina sp. CS-785/01 TaxID=3021716 RepID=UPI0023311F67|nr:hypothetical protein [Spirulina sp. CS-785/01]MDB9312545.1 hypothetical protein [Spirulina sp. CS-785/01]
MAQLLVALFLHRLVKILGFEVKKLMFTKKKFIQLSHQTKSYLALFAKTIDQFLEKHKKKRTFYVIFLVLALLIIISRRPDAITNAQFWAEDGVIFYGQVYERQGDISTLLIPYAGYLHSFQRIVAIITYFSTSLYWSPLFFNIVAIVVQVLPAWFILSHRFHHLIPKFSLRVLIAFLYLAIPNSFEVHANLTNAQWRLAILFFMIIVAKKPRNFFEKIFDISGIIISAFTGIFSTILSPIIAILCWKKRSKRLWVYFGFATLGSLTQLYFLLNYGHSRQTRSDFGLIDLFTLDALDGFLKILGGQVTLSFLLGQNGYGSLLSLTNGNLDWLLLLAGITSVVILGYTLFKSPLELTLFTTFNILIFGAGFLSTFAVSGDLDAVAKTPGFGNRYYFLLMVNLLLILVWMKWGTTPPQVKNVATTALMILCVGIILDWRYDPWVDLNFEEYAKQFQEAPVGKTIEIPIHPPGWFMNLTKH